MVKYTPMKFSLAMAVIVAVAVAHASVRFVVPQLPESPYDDFVRGFAQSAIPAIGRVFEPGFSLSVR